MGGTAIRIVHQGVRFSEDLDFDNRGLDEKEFGVVADIVRRELTLDGYTVAIRNLSRARIIAISIFRACCLSRGCSGHKEERILIQIGRRAPALRVYARESPDQPVRRVPLHQHCSAGAVAGAKDLCLPEPEEREGERFL